MKQRIGACFFGLLLFVACNKKEPDVAASAGAAAARVAAPECVKEIITDEPVKVGETGIVLPAKTKLCFPADNFEIRIELPEGYAILANGENKTLPVYATYSCICSAENSCQVFYLKGLGFGCLQSSCSGSCTGKFTYMGYTVDKVIGTSSKEDFFNLPEVQKVIASMTTDQPFEKRSVYGVSFYLVNNERIFLPQAKCDCEGTQACKLKSLSIPLGPKIYFCEGTCNGCELTIS